MALNSLLIHLTGACIVGGALTSFLRTKDALSPLVVLSPLLLYVYWWRPFVLLANALSELPPEPFELTLMVHLSGVLAFCVGCLMTGRTRRIGNQLNVFTGRMSPRIRRYLSQTSLVIGTVAALVAWSMVYSSWSWIFSSPKPYLDAPVRSGYYRELVNLSYPAMLLAAMAMQGRRIQAVDVAKIFAIGHGAMVIGVFGGRRGPFFLSATCLALSFYLAKARLPTLRKVIPGVLIFGMFLMLLAGNRNRMFQPWKYELDFGSLTTAWSGETVSLGDEFLTAHGKIAAANSQKLHFWGQRLFVIVFVRPIPKQIWPTKYQDLGLEWVERRAGTMGLSSREWNDVAGFEVQGGSAHGFVADAFVEFSWFGVGFCFMVGFMYAKAWQRWVRRRQIWTLIYFLMLVLGIFLVTQSIGAWLYRLILFIVPTAIMWRGVRSRLSRSASRAPVPRPRTVAR